MFIMFVMFSLKYNKYITTSYKIANIWDINTKLIIWKMLEVLFAQYMHLTSSAYASCI